jgi:hypothetical protein
MPSGMIGDIDFPIFADLVPRAIGNTALALARLKGTLALGFFFLRHGVLSLLICRNEYTPTTTQ